MEFLPSCQMNLKYQGEPQEGGLHRICYPAANHKSGESGKVC